ncbi:MAG: hypothetical protein JWO88_3606 [Frankiales bacterium]|nr:hypothetical protein [Frankiales bacterium]
MSSNKSNGKTATFKVGRDAGTGQFKTVPAARRDPQGSVVETMKRSLPQPPKKGR